ncbi:MAG TPA: hypothetical protein VM076_22355 [Gemmatimonadaceae bacterium]|nr:hypothetical protein [Gemmatimonadaceae bacterium]
MRFSALSCLSLATCLTMACSQPPRATPADGPPANLVASATRFFDAYGKAVREGRADAVAGFYASTGAIRVLNGQRQRLTRAALDSSYRGGWQGPAYFAWESLEFDSLDAERVVVTGYFRWQARGAADTSRFTYAALLQAADSGLAIRFEHETAIAGR